ncbi:MAG: ribonuclease R [Maricaulaceae bacterium]
MEDPFDPTQGGIDKTALIAAIRLGEGHFGKRELARALNLGAEHRIALKRALRALEDEGLIEREGRSSVRLSDTLPSVLVVDLYDRDGDGELLARPNRHEGDAPIIRIHPGDAASGPRAVGGGDRALVRLTPDEEGYTARVIRKLPHKGARRRLGVARRDRAVFLIHPTDKRAKDPLLAKPLGKQTLQDGDLVVYEVAREKRFAPPKAKILEVIGSADSPKAASLIALAEHDIPTEFGADELTETDALTPATPDGRTDLRDWPLVTIDPEDAKDFDDAVWAAPLGDPAKPQGWEVIVAIADVSAYVRPDMALDRGAQSRGNSVYLPDRVAPMLPERISNDLCSLRPYEDRPCLAARMRFDARGRKQSHDIVRGWMKSAGRLTYRQAQAAIDGAPDELTAPLLDPVLKPLWGAYRALAQARAERAPLEIDAPERRVRVGEDGTVSGVERRDRLDAHRLIEEFMIQANVCAAETLEAKRTPLIYRVHEEPSGEKIETLASFLPTVGLSWSKGQVLETARFNQLLAKAKGLEHYEAINEMVLRCQAQAVYATDNLGHFGLNLQRYAHFTSPIRRYADLVVHRALIRALGLGEDGLSDNAIPRLATICETITATERRAMAAERDATDRFVAAYLADRIGERFEARISGMARAGAFVRLHETGADGIVPVSRLGAHRFDYDERLQAMIDEVTGERYRLGQSVTVKLVEATPLSGGLMFEILTDPEPAPKGEKRRPARRRPYGDHGRDHVRGRRRRR